MLHSHYDKAHSTGVSLHCHTKYSREFLDFVPYYARMFPIVSTIFNLASNRFEKKNGSPPNFNLGHWEPPLEPLQLIESEAASLELLHLRPIVSITDHDSIEAGLDLHSSGVSQHPISLEWTVPFREAYFHLGIHNLPPLQAKEITNHLLEYTFRNGVESAPNLDDLMSMLNQIPDVLIVLNHPYWDIEMIGQERHDEALGQFNRQYGHYVHAIEVNGFRPWFENQLARELADELDLPMVSGGDRHCLEANSMINVTDATCFSEFVEEVRKDKQSEVLILPVYSQSLTYRQVRSIGQILGHFSEFPVSRRRWSQRVYFDWQDGRGVDSLASRWNGGEPRHYRLAVKAINMLGSPWLATLWNLIDPAMSASTIEKAVQSSNCTETSAGFAMHQPFLESRPDIPIP